MKTIFLTVCSIIFFACSGLINAQVDTVYLNKDEANLVESPTFQIIVSPGDHIMFLSTGGDFAIFIPNAGEFLKIDEIDLKIKITNSSPASAIYEVISADQSIIIRPYTVYSIGNDKWADAPPKIIIRH